MYHRMPCSLTGDALLAILQAHPQSCAGLFAQARHDMHWLYSSAGQSHSLYADDDKYARAEFFTHWQILSNSTPANSCKTLHYVFYAAYEAANLFECLPAAKTDAGVLLWLHQPEWSIALDTKKAVVYIHAADALQLAMLLDWLQKARKPCVTKIVHKYKQHNSVKCLLSDSDYKNAVSKVRTYIRAGDIFQANIARFWQMPYASHDLLALYARLRQVNPAPYGGFWRIPNKDDKCNQDNKKHYLHIISASPERLLRVWSDGRIDTRPIAGTRKRGDGLYDDDDNLRNDLLLSAKERAEHIMLVDLERNDLGRVCQAGSVFVDELMSVEKYATVQHIVSNVCGKLQADKQMPTIFAALFPGGTITGCPKIRCMQIIHELEPCARAAYTGSMGLVTHAAYADVNILIRTFWHTDNAQGSQLHWAAGAGIVADSDPNAELKETNHKVAGLLHAL